MIHEDGARPTQRHQPGEPPRRAARLGAALAAVIAVPAVLAGGCSSSDDPPAGSRQASQPASAPGGSSAGTTVVPGWVKPNLELPTFPLTPGWEPAGIGPRRVGRQGPNVDLMYENSGSVLSVEVGPVAADWQSEPDEEHKSTVGDRPATVRTAKEFDGAAPGDRYVGIRWQLADGQWVQVLSFGPRTEQEVLRFARELRPQGVPASPAGFTIAAAPPGLALQHLSDQYLCLAPPAAMKDRAPRGICVGLVETAQDEDPDATRLTVAGRPATLLQGEPDEPVELGVELANRRTLSITVERDDIPLTREQLIQFAEGVSVSGS